MAAPATHYVKSGDVHIAYQVLGNGPLDLVFVLGFVSRVEGSRHVPERGASFRRLASFSGLVLFDKRGTGMSDRRLQIFTLEQRMHDVQTILEEVGSERAVLFLSEGGSMSLLYAATHPETHVGADFVRQLCQVLLGPDYPLGWSNEINVRHVLSAIRAPPLIYIVLETAGSRSSPRAPCFGNNYVAL
jgi:pimeloyl-ACP methyl ester carboxylesterase